MAKSILAFWVGLFISLANAQGADRPLTLVSLEQPPISYTENGVVKGIAVDIVRRVFKRMDIPIRIKTYPFARTMNSMESNNADGVFAIVKTPERQAFLTYPNEILLEQKAVLFVRSDSKINFEGDFSTMGDLRFGILRGATYGSLWYDALKEGHISKIEEVTDYRQNLKKLVNHRLDVLIGPRFTLLDMIHKDRYGQTIKELWPPIESVPTYLAFSKRRVSHKLVRQFDEALIALRQEGEVDKIVRTYLSN